ncbi:TonB family protein [Caulobacter hibisci]|uniref:TonB family protein n=1 Tax=Caulobacter hibisci TaxID=2035993 RepID=A0ABS0SUR6_9CAUL|nr:TonB family protein [Caulobacter hibisci]MBI1682680.1 TonB family protein [Caulobacter hibisci]
MRRRLAFTLALCVIAAPGALSASGALASPLPIPPPMQRQDMVQRILSYGPPPSVASCDGRKVGVVASAPFAPEVSTAYLPAGSAPDTPARGDRPVSAVTFGIDAKGAPTDLKPASDAPASDEVIAGVARWRFMPGQPVGGCRIEVSQTYTLQAKATTATLLEVVARRKREPLTGVRAAISERGDCGRAPRRIPALTSHPDLRSFEGRDFAAPWAGVLYDIDADGEVRNVRIATQGGDPVLADLAAASIAESRFHPGRPVTGCYGAFSVRPKTAEATAKAYPKALAVPTERDCSGVRSAALNLSVERSYPRNFARQAVEGWALLQFDITPEGRVGPVEIVAAQPAATFGYAARLALQGARPDPSIWGRTGCLVPVTFAMKGRAKD